MVLTILKNISQWEGLSHILWKIIMFQTTNQYIYIYIFTCSTIQMAQPLLAGRPHWPATAPNLSTSGTAMRCTTRLTCLNVEVVTCHEHDINMRYQHLVKGGCGPKNIVLTCSFMNWDVDMFQTSVTWPLLGQLQENQKKSRTCSTS